MVAYSAGGRTTVLVRGSAGWTARVGPTGALVAAAQLDGRLYLATSTAADSSRLWSAGLP